MSERVLRITPDKIDQLKPNEVFVFGSNREGRHGKGAALDARKYYGAIYGQARGIQGNSYGIVTKELRYWLNNPVTLTEIEIQVNALLSFAVTFPDKVFLVTKIGCNLAGFTVEQIAPLFTKAVNMPNVYLPLDFWKVINSTNENSSN